MRALMRVVSSAPHITFIGLSQTLPRQQDMTGSGPRKGNHMKKTLISLSTLALAGGVSLGVLGLNAAAAADDSDAYVKREEKTSSLALAADDNDDDDTNTRTRTGGTDNTGNSRSRADGTNSRVTGVSRDQDRSRGDLTRDWTRDGGDLTRDLTADLTNDKSRNDTRG